VDVRIRMLLRVIDESGGTLRNTPEELGNLLGLGEARVQRLFSREMGKTLKRHLLEVRMARAAQLVRNVVAPIKTVAFDCGYSVVSNFCRDFKRVHGMSPTQMRLRHMGIRAHAELLAFSDTLSSQSNARE
jgi:AraC-like DNA-binding protein